MKALDRKLLRGLRLMWSQTLIIALVVASGVGGFITTFSAVDSLELARDRFCASGRFVDVFASVKRAPNALMQTLLTLPGVADARRPPLSRLFALSCPAWSMLSSVN